MAFEEISARQISEQAADAHRESARYTQPQLAKFFAAHERFVRREPGGIRAIMRFVQAPETDMAGRLLTEADFTGANFRRARMVQTVLERAALYCADMEGVDARAANFLRADLRGASVRSANFAGAVFDGADLRQAILARVEENGNMKMVGRSNAVRLDGGDIAYAVDFSNCSMKGVSLAGTKLKGANFAGAQLQGADLQGADMQDANFVDAIITGAVMSRINVNPNAFARCIQETLPEASSRKAELLARLAQADHWIATGGAEGKPAVLDGEDLRPLADAFARRALTALSARNARGIGCDFRGAQLQGANFTGADLRSADFEGADLRGATFRGANLWHARFHRAVMTPLPLAADRVRACDLTDAKYSPDGFVTAVRALAA